MTPDGQLEPDDSVDVTRQDGIEPRKFAAVASSDTQLTLHGDRWRISAHCTERERRTRWPIG